MFTLKKEFSICCSHRLHNNKLSDTENRTLFGKCNNLPNHGHNYRIILMLESKELNEKTGMIMNFYDIKALFNHMIDNIYDHKCLNECPEFEGVIPTAENMCKVFYDTLKPVMPALKYVEIYETEGASAGYYGS